MKKFIALALALVLTLSLCGCDSMDYKEAMKLFDAGNYEDAREMFVQLGDYEDSAQMVNKCDYELAVECLEAGEYANAAQRFTELGDYEDSAERVKECNYLQAGAYAEAGEYQKACQLYEELGSYEDSAAKWEECMTLEIDRCLQGSWEAALTSSLAFHYRFSKGRFDVELGGITNEGDYRIDVKNKEIYVCYDYILSSSGKRPNTEEQLLFTFTYVDGEFDLISALDVSNPPTIVKK